MIKINLIAFIMKLLMKKFAILLQRLAVDSLVLNLTYAVETIAKAKENMKMELSKVIWIL